MPKPDFRSILQALVEREVDFIVVGGVAIVLTGAAYNTFDLDVVHSTDPENVARLLDALEGLDAYYRIQPERRFRPNASHLTSPGHQLLLTKYGPLDLLGRIGNGRSYDDLLPHAVLMDFNGGLRIRVLDVETQIAVKEETGREKDLPGLLLLRHVLEESRKKI
jgi:predicted nucleotidyltransferase